MIDPFYVIPFVVELAFAIRLVTRGLNADTTEPARPVPVAVRPRPLETNSTAVMTVSANTRTDSTTPEEQPCMQAIVQDRYGSADVLDAAR